MNVQVYYGSFFAKRLFSHTRHLIHEVVGTEEVAGPATHDEGTAVDVDQDCPRHPARQPRREHVQAARQGRSRLIAITLASHGKAFRLTSHNMYTGLISNKIFI